MYVSSFVVFLPLAAISAVHKVSACARCGHQFLQPLEGGKTTPEHPAAAANFSSRMQGTPPDGDTIAFKIVV